MSGRKLSLKIHTNKLKKQDESNFGEQQLVALSKTRQKAATNDDALFQAAKAAGADISGNTAVSIAIAASSFSSNMCQRA